jgi:hypothetical protein
MESMRTALIVFMALFLTVFASAQTHGYAFFAPGGATSGGYTVATYHAGVGGEGVFRNGIGIGGEVGYLSTRRDFDFGFGLASLNGSYHFNKNATVVPFVTGGYSLAFRSGTANLGNFGGGVNWWFWPKLGVKIEFRDHVHTDMQWWGFRFGVTFR